MIRCHIGNGLFFFIGLKKEKEFERSVLKIGKKKIR